MNKPNQTKTNMQTQRTKWWLPEGKEWQWGKGKIGKGDQMYSEEWKINFWWSAHYRLHRSRNIMLYA